MPISSITRIPWHDIFGRASTQQPVPDFQLARDQGIISQRGISSQFPGGTALCQRPTRYDMQHDCCTVVQSMLMPMGVASRRFGGPPCDVIERSAYRSSK